MKSNPVTRISIKYLKPSIIKIDGEPKTVLVKEFIGYQIPEKALYLHAFQQTVKLKEDIRFQLKKIENDLPKWRSGDKKAIKESRNYLSPRPPPKNKRNK